jgi:hypothetical protein
VAKGRLQKRDVAGGDACGAATRGQGGQSGQQNIHFRLKQFYFLRSINCKLLSFAKSSSINDCDLFEVHNFCRGDQSGY